MAADRTRVRTAPTAAFDRYCCKSRKSNNHKNLAKVNLKTSPLPHWLSVRLRTSVIDFGSIDMVPHIAARKMHQRLYDFLFDLQKDFCNPIDP